MSQQASVNGRYVGARGKRIIKVHLPHCARYAAHFLRALIQALAAYQFAFAAVAAASNSLGQCMVDDEIVTNGGRVLCATALGDSVAAATASAYGIVDTIDWDGVMVRRDIAWRAIERES